NPIAACAAPPGIHLAAHFAREIMWRLFASEGHKPDGALRLTVAKYPRHFEQNRDTRSIVVGSWRRLNGIVMRAEHNELICSRRSLNLSHKIRDIEALSQVPLSLNRIAGHRQLSLDKHRRGFQRLGSTDVPRSNQASQPINMPA